MHCRSLHIHVPSQRRACPDAGGKQMEDSEKGIYPKNKKPNLCPYHSAKRFACFVLFLFLIAPLTDGQRHISRQKSSPNRVARLPAAPTMYRQKSISLTQALLLRQLVWHSNSNGVMVKLKHLQIWWVQLSKYWAYTSSIAKDMLARETYTALVLLQHTALTSAFLKKCWSAE